jgi:hypothetical protein
LPAASAARPAGPVAQWLEPAAHNGLVAGSSPAGPTNEIRRLSRAISPQREHRTRYVRLSFAGRFAHGDLLYCIRQIIRVMMPVGVEQDLKTFRDNRLPARDLRPFASAKSPLCVATCEGIFPDQALRA